MTETPKSLTAAVHVRLNYQESGAEAPDSREIEILSKIIDHTSSLSPEGLEVVAEVTDYLVDLTGRAAPTSSAQLDLPRKTKEG